MVLTVVPFFQQTVGAGSPLISTSRRTLLPATTIMVFLFTRLPIVSRWIFGGSGGKESKKEERKNKERFVSTDPDSTSKPFYLFIPIIIINKR